MHSCQLQGTPLAISQAVYSITVACSIKFAVFWKGYPSELTIPAEVCRALVIKFVEAGGLNL